MFISGATRKDDTDMYPAFLHRHRKALSPGELQLVS